jgi:hypothetical protein
MGTSSGFFTTPATRRQEIVEVLYKRTKNEKTRYGKGSRGRRVKPIVRIDFST